MSAATPPSPRWRTAAVPTPKPHRHSTCRKSGVSRLPATGHPASRGDFPGLRAALAHACATSRACGGAFHPYLTCLTDVSTRAPSYHPYTLAIPPMPTPQVGAAKLRLSPGDWGVGGRQLTAVDGSVLNGASGLRECVHVDQLCNNWLSFSRRFSAHYQRVRKCAPGYSFPPH